MYQSNQHITVLLKEAVEALNICPDGIYVDGTFGRGGHSRLILQQLSALGRLVVFDKDPQAIEVAHQLAREDDRVTVIHQGFCNLRTALSAINITHINGLLMDLGLSSPQLDEAQRGFSFRFDAPLDMRMDTSQGMTAAMWLAETSEEEIATVLRDYGEEKFYRRIAATIVADRVHSPIKTTQDLADLCARCVKTREKNKHPATRTFQAIRIAINGEMQELESVLDQSLQCVKSKGRVVTIAFHSLEDRIVKQFIRHHSRAPEVPKWVMVRDDEIQMPLRAVGKAIFPSEDEVACNLRARSAVMRVFEVV